jgi:hypothetical protein
LPKTLTKENEKLYGVESPLSSSSKRTSGRKTNQPSTYTVAATPKSKAKDKRHQPYPTPAKGDKIRLQQQLEAAATSSTKEKKPKEKEVKEEKESKVKANTKKEKAKKKRSKSTVKKNEDEETVEFLQAQVESLQQELDDMKVKVIEQQTTADLFKKLYYELLGKTIEK